jgi:NAD(P)H-dependent FMN reductase
MDVEFDIADLAGLALPFYDAETPPSAPGFVAPHESAQEWSRMVRAASGVVFVAPEYNHSLSALQKNAIDWLYGEWKDKPVAFVGYGFNAARYAREQFDVLGGQLKWRLVEPTAALQLGNVISPEGEIIEPQVVRSALNATLHALIAATSQS